MSQSLKMALWFSHNSIHEVKGYGANVNDFRITYITIFNHIVKHWLKIGLVS
jgi:hypothetical protein